jgi:hypothetical protein
MRKLMMPRAVFAAVFATIAALFVILGSVNHMTQGIKIIIFF